MKMNRISRILALALVLVIVLGAFSGCGKGPSDQELIVGKWQTGIGMSEFMNELDDEEAAEMLKGVDLSDVSMNMIMEFKEDGTFSLSLDKASGEEAMREMASRITPNLKEYLRGEYASSTGVDPSSVSDADLDALLPMIGVESWDDVGDMIMEEFDADEVFGDASYAGKYLVKNGKLYVTDSVDQEATELSDESSYELKDDSLKITFQDSIDLPESMKELTFTRVQSE